MRAPRKPLLHSETTDAIIDAFREVYDELGFGYRERIYSLAMGRILIAKGHRVEREKRVMVYFRGEPLAPQMIDMIVDGKVIVENKASEQLPSGASPQLFSYLCSTDIEVGMLLHFGRTPRFDRLLFENRFKKRLAGVAPVP